MIELREKTALRLLGSEERPEVRPLYKPPTFLDKLRARLPQGADLIEKIFKI